MKLDLYETWYDVGGGIKKAPKKNRDQYVHARARNTRKRACTFLYLVVVFKRCRNGGDEEKESWRGGSNVYSQRFSHLCERARTHGGHKREES